MYTYERSKGYITEDRRKELWPRCETCNKLLNREEKTFGVGKCGKCVANAAEKLADDQKEI